MPPPLTDSCRAQAHIPRPRPVPAAHLVLVSCRLVQSVPVKCSRCRSSTSTSFILIILLDVLTGRRHRRRHRRPRRRRLRHRGAVSAAAVPSPASPPPCRRPRHASRPHSRPHHRRRRRRRYCLRPRHRQPCSRPRRRPPPPSNGRAAARGGTGPPRTAALPTAPPIDDRVNVVGSGAESSLLSSRPRGASTCETVSACDRVDVSLYSIVCVYCIKSGGPPVRWLMMCDLRL